MPSASTSAFGSLVTSCQALQPLTLGVPSCLAKRFNLCLWESHLVLPSDSTSDFGSLVPSCQALQPLTLRVPSCLAKCFNLCLWEYSPVSSCQVLQPLTLGVPSRLAKRFNLCNTIQYNTIQKSGRTQVRFPALADLSLQKIVIY